MKYLVQIVQYLKNKTILKNTWHWEAIFVALVLLSVFILTSKSYIEALGTLAVFFTFMHASVAERLSEAEEKRSFKQEKVIVACYYKLSRYFYMKEVLWFLYFSLLGAWSALIGVIIFLLYPIWRKYWRKYSF